MKRGRFAFFTILAGELSHLLKTLRHQRMGKARILAVVLFLVGFVFFFLASNPILSPFIYPLF